MIRFGAAATNVLATRATPVAVRILPASAVIAFASPAGCCARCCSISCAAVAAHRCSSSSSGSGSSRSRCGNGVAAATSTCTAVSRRARGLGAASGSTSAREPLRRNAAVATPTPQPAAASPGGAQPLCDPSAYQSLSLLIVLHECIRRVYGSPLLEAADLLALPAKMESLPCCVLLLVQPDTQPSHRPGQPSASQSVNQTDSESDPRSSNRVAAGSVSASPAFPSQYHVGEAVPCGAGGDPGGTSRCTGAECLSLAYCNRSASEALQIAQVDGTSASYTSSSCSSSWWVQLQDLDADVLHSVLSGRGPPKRGSLLSLRLTPLLPPATGSNDASEDSACAPGTKQRTIHCPEALLLPLMSPNGNCAGVAVLFERWEVRDEAGRVALEGRPLVPELPPGSQPGEEAVRQLQQAVRAQADEVRALKAQQGLTNQDPRVVEAVAVLQELKARLDLQERLRRAFGGEDSVLRRVLSPEFAAD